jgi:hypothetical protein
MRWRTQRKVAGIENTSDPDRQSFVTSMADAHRLGSFDEVKLERKMEVRKSTTTGGGAKFVSYKKLCDEKGEVVAAALIEQPNCVKRWMNGLSRETPLKWPSTHEFMFTEDTWSWGEHASEVIGATGVSDISADAANAFEDMFKERMAPELPTSASSNIVPPLHDGDCSDKAPVQDDAKHKEAVEAAMKHCSKAIVEWNSKVRTYRGTLKRALDHINTKDCIVSNHLVQLVTDGDSTLTNLLAVDAKYRAKQVVTTTDIATITRDSASIYTIVKTCNKKNAGLVNLFSC